MIVFCELNDFKVNNNKIEKWHITFCSATFFCARKNATHFSLSGAKKRQLQPKRYTNFFYPCRCSSQRGVLPRGLYRF